jgi:hypothetical protein
MHKTVDNYVGNVYKGRLYRLSFKANFSQNMLKYKGILLKDMSRITIVSRETCYS